MRHVFSLWLSVFAPFMWLASGCVTVAAHPCTKGSQPPYDDGRVGKGTKQCHQIRDTGGNYVNQGKYVEWYPSGQRALEGEYAAGLKTGKWTEWDEQGRKLGEKWYELGVIVPGREAQAYNGLGIAPRAIAPVPAPSSVPTPSMR